MSEPTKKTPGKPDVIILESTVFISLWHTTIVGDMAARYTPVTTYQPIFKEVFPLETVYTEIPPDIMGIFQASQILSIRQHVKLLPKQCCVCPPCVKQTNTYSVYAGMTRDAQAEFLRIDEVMHFIILLIFLIVF